MNSPAPHQTRRQRVSEIKVGDRVRATNSAELDGKDGTVVAPGIHQFEDEFTVHLDGYADDECHYLRSVNLEKIEPVKAAPSNASSFHFFETLLDASEEAHPNSKRFYN